MAESIPQPPGLPLLGNVNDIDPQNGMRSLRHLSEKYGMFLVLSAIRCSYM